MGTKGLISAVVSAGLLLSACGDDTSSAVPAPPPATGSSTTAPAGSVFSDGATGPVAELFGLTLAEFSDRVAELGYGPVREGWRDGEFLPVDEDLSPGRVTVAIDSSSGDDIVIDASIEIDEESDEDEDEDASAGAFDPSAELRQDLMTAEPAVVAAGQTFDVTYPGGRDRGIAYVLEVSAGGWTPTHLMTASTDGYDGGPSWVEFDTDGYGVPDIGISGEGPDTLIVPDTTEPGSYRLCTANSAENICTPLIVTDGPTDPPTTSAPIASIVSTTEGVAYYPACGTERLTLDGITWYIIARADSGAIDEMFAEQWDAISARQREPSPAFGPSGLVRVVEPGPGDDIGTLVIWGDGVARWQSDSGDLDVWLVTNELEVFWDC